MGTYLPPEACKKEEQAVIEAKEALDKAYSEWKAAHLNVEAGMWGSGAGVLGIIACAAASVTGVGAVICLGAGGATVVSGSLWTASGIPGLSGAREKLENAIDEMEKAIEAYCDCINSNTVSVPD